MTVYFKNAGHCTRCDEPFGGNATAYMVREDVAWTVLDGYTALTQQETVPVCDACVTAQELAKATIDATCVGCGQRMRLNIHWRKATCSNRCEQRERRKQRRIKRVKCTVCKTYFETARTDAKFCSGLCRQWAYRLRRSVGAIGTTK